MLERPRYPHSFISPVALRCLFALVLFAGAATAGAGIRPDYFAARRFGYALQHDFQKRPKDALVDRLDSAAMMKRAFGPFGSDVTEDPRAKDMWEKVSFPQFTSELRSLGEMNTLVLSRISLVDDARWIECLLLTDNGSFRLMSLRLNEAPDGTIRIEDFRFAGSEMEASRILRQILILSGVRMLKRLDDEESELCDLSARYPMLFHDVFTAFQQQHYDFAFHRMCDTPAKLQRTRIWRQLRYRLANLGSADAQKQLDAACLAGEEDPFLRYSFLVAKGDHAKALPAFEQVVKAYHGLAFFRSVEADLLIGAGRSHEAFCLAREVYQTNPLLNTAYLAAVHGAVADRQFGEAITTLDAWRALAAPQQIDEWLKKVDGLAGFLASPSYTEWSKGKTSGPHVTEPTPSN